MNEHNKTINNEPHEEATVPERQLVSQESPKKRRKMMRDVPAKINQLRELAKEGYTREAICGILGINRQGFETLRHKLNDMDKWYYDIPHEEADRGGKVGKGGISVTGHHLLAMGAAEIFPLGTAISIRLEGERILIERASTKRSPDEQREVGTVESLADWTRELVAQEDNEGMEA